MISDMKLAEIQSRCNQATSGPWVYVGNLLGIFSEKISRSNLLFSFLNHREIGAKASVEDAVFIAHAREDIPDLLEAIRELKTKGKTGWISMAEGLPPIGSTVAVVDHTWGDIFLVKWTQNKTNNYRRLGYSYWFLIPPLAVDENG